MSPLPISFFGTQRCDLSTTVKKTRIFIFFPSCVQIINSSCSRIIVNMNHESFKLLLMTLMMIKLYKITVFTKNTISFYRKNNKKIVIFCRKLRFCFTQNFNSCVVNSTDLSKIISKEDMCGRITEAQSAILYLFVTR